MALVESGLEKALSEKGKKFPLRARRPREVLDQAGQILDPYYYIVNLFRMFCQASCILSKAKVVYLDTYENCGYARFS